MVYGVGCGITAASRCAICYAGCISTNVTETVYERISAGVSFSFTLKKCKWFGCDTGNVQRVQGRDIAGDLLTVSKFPAILDVISFDSGSSSATSAWLALCLSVRVSTCTCVCGVGYGFVDFETAHAADAAVKALQAKGIQAQMAKVRITLLTRADRCAAATAATPVERRENLTRYCGRVSRASYGRILTT